MALTAHKTVQMFMRYIHNEDNPVRSAAEAVAARRREIIASAPTAPTPAAVLHDSAEEPLPSIPETAAPTRTSLGNYRPYRHRRDEDRSASPPIGHGTSPEPEAFND